MIVNDQTIRRLNKQFRDIDQATDVLSFAAAPNSTSEPLLGSIAVGAGVAARQAAQAGITTTQEIKSLSAHALLHLLGYHHQ